ncbi:MAG TPA: ABC transporter permease [Pyrinomonadaceae bacterium]|nr:ABC transporter permease [Pyrinomonadaceae bacterium]
MINENARASAPRTSGSLQPTSDLLHSAFLLPEEPVIRIRPSRPFRFINLSEVWAYRDLFYFFVWRDLKVRYKQTVLGALWVILQPLLMTLIFVVFLGIVVHVPTEHVPYPLFLYAALLTWTFFSNAIASSSYSLVVNAPMITKVYFPRVIVPVAAVAVRLSDFLIASVILLVLLVYYGVRPSWNLFMLPPLVVHLTILATGIGLWLSALNVKYRDVGTVIPVLLQLWMFVSPIIYPASLVPARWRMIYNLNPLVGIIENVRASLFGLPFDRGSMISSAVITLLILVYSAYVFHRMEDEFADVV